MTAKEICALAFDEAGITFAEDANGGNKSFYKNQIKNGGFDGSQKSGSGGKADGADEPFDLQKHDQQHHGGHYDGGKCKYREDAVKNGLITKEQAAQKTGQPGQGGGGGPQNPQEQQQQKEEPPQITPEQLLEQFKQHPESISGAKEGIKSEQPQQTDTPVGPITTESPVQEAVVKGLSEEAESGNPEAVKALNNLKAFNDLKEEIGAFQRMEGESNDAFIDRFNKLVEGIDPNKFDERQRSALSALAQMQQTRIEQDVGQQMVASRTEGATEPEAPQPTGNPPRVAGRASQRVNPETGLFEYTGADGKTYVDVSGLGAFEAMQAAMKAAAAGKEFLDKWDKYSGKWAEIMNAHQTDSTADQNRRASINAVANVTREDESLRMMKDFAEKQGLDPMDRQDALNRIAVYEASSGNIEKQAKIFATFSKWSASKMPKQQQANAEKHGSLIKKDDLDDEEKKLFDQVNFLPNNEVNLEDEKNKANPLRDSYDAELKNLQMQNYSGHLDARQYDAAVKALKAKYKEQGYNPDPEHAVSSGWQYNVPAKSLFQEISNDEQRAIVTESSGENINEALKNLGYDAKIDGTPRQDANETTFYVKLGPQVDAKKLSRQVDTFKNKLGENGLRIDATVNGMPGYVAFHIPNAMQDIIGFTKYFDNPESKKLLETSAVPIPVGAGQNGELIVKDLAKTRSPHAFVGGATKSGKSVGLTGILCAALFKGPKNLTCSVIDPKKDYEAFDGVKGVSRTTDAQKGLNAAWAAYNERAEMLSKAGCNNIEEYNAKFPNNPMPYHLVLFDEMPMAIANNGGTEGQFAKDIDSFVKVARHAGMHVVGAGQEAGNDQMPSGLNKNLGERISFRTNTGTASFANLQLGAREGGGAANTLKGYGDGLIKNEDDTLTRFQGAFIPPKDIARVVGWRKEIDAGNLEMTKRTPEDRAREERESFGITPGDPALKNYTVDPSKAGNDPGSALQMTASSIISDAKNLSKQEALGHLDKAYQQYLNSMPEGEGRDKLAAAYNTIKNEMMANEAGHPYKPDAPAPAQPQGGEGGTTGGKEPPQVQPENLVSQEEAQQLAQKAADKKKFEENHAKYHPTDQKGEEALENEMYNDEANELYKQKEEGKISASKFRKRLSELDEGHKQKLADIADKYGSQGGGEQPKPDNGGQQQQKPQDGQKPTEGVGEVKADGVDKGDDSDPLSMFTNESDEQRRQRARNDYNKTAEQIKADYDKRKITFEEAQKLSKEAQAKRDKLIAGGKSDEQKTKEEEETEAKLRETVRTDDGHGKTVAHAIPGVSRGAKGATTPLSFADHQILTKSLPRDFVLEGGDKPMRDGFGNIWAHHRGGKGNGSRGWFDKNNQWHYAVNTTHPAYKGENSPEAQAAKQNWLSPKTPMNKAQEAQARKQYMNLAFGIDEAIPGFGLDCIDNAILDYFRHMM